MNESLAKAVLHSRLPDIASERRFAETLLSLDYPKGDEPHIWFVKLPGIRDVDAVIWQRRFGLFLVEIKSWPLSGIRALSLAHFELEPWVKHATAKSPWEQVTDACYQLLERFRSDNQLFRELGSPWLAPVVALFAIDRSSFLLRFQGESGTRSEDEFKNRISRGTIFAEDLATGDELLQRLGECRQYPIIGMAPKGNHRHVDVATATRLISAAIAPILLNTRQLNAYDQHRIRQLELELEERARDINWDIPAVITGHVGTGKTFLALRAARERLRVLSALNSSTPSICMFVCFNKVLATDISRLRDLSPSFRNLRFDCLDIFELVRFLSRRMDIDLAPPESDADDWVTHQVDRILAEEQPDFARMLQSWSLIIVDEAQDLKDWAWRLLDRLSGGGIRLLVIDGKRQLLYSDARADYLDTLVHRVRSEMRSANYLELKRVFRTTDATFLISQIYVDAYPDLMEVNRLWKNRYQKQYRKAKLQAANEDPSAQQAPLYDDFELPRSGGNAPKLIPLERNARQSWQTRVTEIVRTAYDQTRQYIYGEQPSSLLILVPFPAFSNRPVPALPPQARNLAPPDWRKLARTACEDAGLSFVDYTDNSQRRRIYSGDEVRICTFHSSRGIESAHTVVLGFDDLANSARSHEWIIQNLGYIVLSRSQFDTDIVYVEADSLEHESWPVTFLKDLLFIVGL